MGSREHGATVLAIVLCSARAAAQAPAESAAVARELFDQARALLAEKDFAHACPKFEEAMRLDPGGGTILNLALCNELRGKTETAWALYDEAGRWARRDGRADREQFALEHRAALERKLARLVVVLESGAKVPGLSVRRNGVPLGEASLGEALPVDAGEHTVEAHAPGKKPLRLTVRLRDGAVRTVSIPALADDGSTKKPPPRLVREQPADAQKTWGTVLIGAGAAATLAGLRFGWQAIEQRKDAEARCPNRECEHRDAVQLNDDARRNALASTLLVASGLGLAGAGTYVLLTAEPDSRAAGLALRGRF